MSEKNGNGNGKATQIQGFVRGQLEEAQKRLAAIEAEAEKALKEIVAKGKAQRKELEGMLVRLKAGELFDPKVVKQWAEQAGVDVLGRLDALQSRVAEAAGVATQQQVKEIHEELGKLSKKLDALSGKKPAGKAETRV
jgi:hypothetical protein